MGTTGNSVPRQDTLWAPGLSTVHCSELWPLPQGRRFPAAAGNSWADPSVRITRTPALGLHMAPLQPGGRGVRRASAFLRALAVQTGGEDETTIHDLSGKWTDRHHGKDELAPGADTRKWVGRRSEARKKRRLGGKGRKGRTEMHQRGAH